ncbi:uncharacterized protein CELE_Y17D7C.6 [Caenorhabditis elegans]|uniref:Uncharacterized protein n=1 Tax=Caenorhabditis elegans TaxID=6239 RepID=K7ZUN4_CAEEL|nr:Uncharacterized protein CELE_Y17D7C.6 [Caenorhabditis elegans]CCE72356.2 Uncharacterized protein CELE_Y17D7C.6 [Caenorhabditis elegans]|eukprot:NP_001263931.1 Uncharacterized protein CELE_Y17D7C.6 [Caenorhabditis elegans]
MDNLRIDFLRNEPVKMSYIDTSLVEPLKKLEINLPTGNNNGYTLIKLCRTAYPPTILRDRHFSTLVARYKTDEEFKNEATFVEKVLNDKIEQEA